jgi:hypothetical protein
MKSSIAKESESCFKTATSAREVLAVVGEQISPQWENPLPMWIAQGLEGNIIHSTCFSRECRTPIFFVLAWV